MAGVRDRRVRAVELSRGVVETNTPTSFRAVARFMHLPAGQTLTLASVSVQSVPADQRSCPKVWSWLTDRAQGHPPRKEK